MEVEGNRGFQKGKKRNGKETFFPIGQKRLQITAHIPYAIMNVNLLMGISENLVQEIVQRITSVTQPDRIILFGSASTGQMTKDSDIDLLVLEHETYDNRKERLRIQQALNDLGHSFDVIVMPTDRFEESKNVIGGIAYPAHKYGRVVYETAGRG